MNMDPTSYLTCLATGLTFALVYYHIKVFTYWSRRGIKGPTPWPLLGTNIYYLFRTKVEVDMEWRQKYGHLYGTYEGYRPCIRLTDNELIKHVYVKNFSSFTDRNNLDVHGKNMKLWFFWSSGDHWSNQRVLITPMFTSAKLKSMFNIMSSCVDRFLEETNSRFSASLKAATALVGSKDDSDEIIHAKAQIKASESTVYSKDDLMALTLDVIARTFFSFKLNTYRDKSSEFFKRAFAFASFDVPNFILWLVIPRFIAKRIEFDLVPKEKFEYFETLSEKIINDRRKRDTGTTATTGEQPAIKRYEDFIQAFLEAEVPEKLEGVHSIDDDKEAFYNDNTSHTELDQIYQKQAQKISFRKFNDREIKSQMTFLFIAGFDTTSLSLSKCIYELAHQQKAQELVYQELIENFSNSGTEGERFNVEYAQLLALKQLNAFVSECLRLYSPVTDHNRLVTVKEGVTLPSNPPIHLEYKTSISVPGFVLQRDPDYWTDSLKFDLTRFYPENRHKMRTCTYMPFGLGPRNCAGMRFALLEIKLALAKLLLSYQVLPGPNSQMYPPKFNQHAFFLQLKHTDYRLEPRVAPLITLESPA